MKIIVTDKETIEAGLVVKSTYVVISIRDPGTRKARIQRTAGLVDILYLAFHDAEPSPTQVLPKNIKLMTEEHAKRIWAFVNKHKDQVGTIVVHCHQGMSRSPAIAAALANAAKEDDSWYLSQYQPNEFIRQLLLRTRKEL